MLSTSQESKAASKLTDQVLSDVQRSSNDLSKLNSWLQVGCLTSCQDRLLLFAPGSVSNPLLLLAFPNLAIAHTVVTFIANKVLHN
jgi:hypothetical protein